jgi:hypothetical protein
MFVGISPNKFSKDVDRKAKISVYDIVADRIVHEIIMPFPEIYSVCLIENGFMHIPALNNLFGEKNSEINALQAKLSDLHGGSLLSEQEALSSDGLNVDLSIKNMPTVMKINTDYKIAVKVENNSNITTQSIGPYPVYISYHWKNPETNEYILYDGIRTPFDTPLFPFSYMNINMRLKTPISPGQYKLEISLVQELQFWFEEYCPNLPKSVIVSIEEE